MGNSVTKRMYLGICFGKRSQIQNAGKETKNLVVGNLIFAEFPDVFFSGGSWFLQLHPGTDSFSILSVKKKKTNKQTNNKVSLSALHTWTALTNASGTPTTDTSSVGSNKEESGFPLRFAQKKDVDVNKPMLGCL